MRLARCVHCRLSIEDYEKPGQTDRGWLHIDTLVPWCSPELYDATVPSKRFGRRVRYEKAGGYVAEPIPHVETFCA